jgi:cysteine dioxygenase
MREFAMPRACHTVEQLSLLARAYEVGRETPAVFSADRYTRRTVYRDEGLEVVVICFAEGQATSVHDHQGSNCVVRILRGKVLETRFAPGENRRLDVLGSRCLLPGDVAGLGGTEIHQVCNLDPAGTVLVNFYSPPFQVDAGAARQEDEVAA